MMTLTVTLPNPNSHPTQRAFVESKAKRIIVRAGRRGGKTVGAAIKAAIAFLKGRRVLYAAPTDDQVERFWTTVKNALQSTIDEGVYYKNETKRLIELSGTEQRIRAKTAWNADTLRGDYADLLILDEYQLMNEDAWGLVGAPMLLDNNGDAVFIYTPPSIRTAGVSKARDKQHAKKLFKAAQNDTSDRWRTFHFSSHENPHISREALGEIIQDMTDLAYRQEIEAEDIDEIPGALWTRANLEATRITEPPTLARIVVAIDPAATANQTSSETGIIVAGKDENDHGYTLEDCSLRASPDAWARAAINAYDYWEADRIIAETNNGGDMVESTIRQTAKSMHQSGDRETAQIAVKQVRASRGKQTRAEPVAALYEQRQRRCHHVGGFPELEDQLCSWLPGDPSPDRLDALVWAMTDLLLGPNQRPSVNRGIVLQTDSRATHDRTADRRQFRGSRR